MAYFSVFAAPASFVAPTAMAWPICGTTTTPLIVGSAWGMRRGRRCGSMPSAWPPATSTPADPASTECTAMRYFCVPPTPWPFGRAFARRPFRPAPMRATRVLKSRLCGRRARPPAGMACRIRPSGTECLLVRPMSWGGSRRRRDAATAFSRDWMRCGWRRAPIRPGCSRRCRRGWQYFCSEKPWNWKKE